MGRIGRILKNRMEKFIYNTIETRLQLNFENKMYAPAGIHCVPLKDDRMILVKIDGTGKFGVVGTLNELQPGLDSITEGDIWLFSRDPRSGKYQTWIKLNHDGTLEIDTPSNVTINNHAKVNVHITGATDLKCDDDVTIQVEKKVDVHVTGETTFKCDDNVTIDSPNVTVQGGKLVKNGSVPAEGSGGFCCITNCHYDGAPHVGTMIVE